MKEEEISKGLEPSPINATGPMSGIFTTKRLPHRCPVCNGNGTVDNGFYSRPGTCPTWASSSTAPEMCRSCGGTGIVWGIE